MSATPEDDGTLNPIVIRVSPGANSLSTYKPPSSPI